MFGSTVSFTPVSRNSIDVTVEVVGEGRGIERDPRAEEILLEHGLRRDVREAEDQLLDLAVDDVEERRRRRLEHAPAAADTSEDRFELPVLVPRPRSRNRSGRDAMLYANRRRHERFALSPMHTQIAVRPMDSDAFSFEGHAYDISEGGVQFELDRGFEPGTPDAYPLMGALPGVENGFVVGCVRGGYTIGPLAGRGRL